MHDTLKWFAVSRKEIPGVLHGFESPRMLCSPPENNKKFLPSDMAIAFAENPIPSSAPLVGVIDDGQIPDLLSWISTYAPEAFPISQNLRVLGLNDWNNIVDSDNAILNRTFISKESIWPSVIIGEMLGQGDAEVDLLSLPLSRAYACFSFAQARSSIIYGSQSPLTQLCKERLQSIEKDPVFVKRSISVDRLIPMWAFVDESPTRLSMEEEIIYSVTRILDDKNPQEAVIPSDFFGLSLRVDIISSGSLEQRVLEFERVTEILVKESGYNPELRKRIPVLLAAFAILVGRGTSHVALLEEFARHFPTVYAWFGVFAGLLGPKGWDAAWLRVATSIERILRSSYSIQDPPTADVCWVEYDWIRGQKESSVWFKEVPKLYPRLMSVEIVPGSTCQFRLADGAQTESKIPPTQQAIVRKQESPVLADNMTRDRRLKLIASLEAQLVQFRESLSHLREAEQLNLVQPGFFDSQQEPNAPINDRKKTSARKKTKKENF
jgi:hypothetical protein